MEKRAQDQDDKELNSYFKQQTKNLKETIKAKEAMTKKQL